LRAWNGCEADGGVDGLAEDLLRGVGGDLLDVHAALGGGHDGGAAGDAVEGDAEVELAGDVHALLDEQALDLLALGAGLDGDQGGAEHLLGDLDGGRRRS
jgi:hypothetical protein